MTELQTFVARRKEKLQKMQKAIRTVEESEQ
jgi:hypothetical protein